MTLYIRQSVYESETIPKPFIGFVNWKVLWKDSWGEQTLKGYVIVDINQMRVYYSVSIFYGVKWKSFSALPAKRFLGLEEFNACNIIHTKSFVDFEK
jgi:hypothetical protein